MLRIYTCATCGANTQADDEYTAQLTCTCGRTLIVDDQQRRLDQMAGRDDAGILPPAEPIEIERRPLSYWGRTTMPHLAAGMQQHAATMRALRETFGYEPDERGGEKWTVYQDRMLIVIHPERRPRLYERGCNGVYFEFEPPPWL